MRFIKVMASVMVLFLAIGGVAFCGSISGQVVDKVTQEPVEDASLWLYKWNEDKQHWEYVYWDDSDENGNFSFSDLDNGTYIVRIKSCWYCDDFFDIKKTYFPQWYDGVLGRWDNKDSATKIELTDSEPDKSITINLEPSPVSAGLSAQKEVPSQGGNIKYGVRVKNWTDHALSLKIIIRLEGQDYNGMWFESPLIKVISFNLSGLEDKSKILSLNVPEFAADGWYWIEVEVGPSDRYPWFLYSIRGMGFEKRGTTLSIITDKEKLKEFYLKRIPKVLK